jgi:hypothetical protein
MTSRICACVPTKAADHARLERHRSTQCASVANATNSFDADVAVERYPKKHGLDHGAAVVQLNAGRMATYAASKRKYEEQRTQAEPERVLGLVDGEESQ